NPATGALAPGDCIDDTTTGPDSCAQSTIGLSGAFGGSSVALDPRGESLYVASAIDNAVVELARNPVNKLITPLGCIDDNDTGPDPCSASTDGLDHASAVTVTPDGSSVYATSQVDGAIVGFSRDQATGLLTPQGCIDAPSGPDTCAQTAEGVGNSYAVAVTPDSRSVFTVARAGTVVGFDRDPATGLLHPATCVTDTGHAGRGFCSAEAPALDNAFDIAVSPDGNSAYAVSQIDGIQIFGLNPPDTSLVAGPKAKTDHRLATFKFGSEESGATFTCTLDKQGAKACTSPRKVRVKPGTHSFSVAATDPAGNADATPDEYRWRVNKRD
ncbi:MAG: hypothetical protein QOI10_438, partial [Solirubrobacterales bacterium]|nr:hypothetical protein [Solirubrobacterales bacterium]